MFICGSSGCDLGSVLNGCGLRFFCKCGFVCVCICITQVGVV